MEKLELDLPPGIRVRPIGPGQTPARMLANGELDAFHTARAPSTFYSEPDRGYSEPDRERRLFPDDVAVEQDDFARTRIFPIMHLIAIRRAVYRANPWVAIQPVRGVRRQPAHHLTRG